MTNYKEWKWTGVDDYYVSEDGEIYNYKFSRYIVTPENKKTGYQYFSMGGKTRNVHEVVCTAFHGEKPQSHFTVDHHNRNKTDNNYTNLSWVTQKENNSNRSHKGTMATKLSHEQYIELVTEYITGGYTLGSITDWGNDRFKRDSHTMVYSNILLGKSYAKWFYALSIEIINSIRSITKSNTTRIRK